MEQFKVLVSDKVDESVVDIFESTGKIKVDYKPGISKEELIKIIGEYDGLVVRSRTKVTKEVLENPGKLKVIGRAGAGVDNIDLEAATKKGIIVMNTPGGNTISTAEHTFAMIMAVSRSIPQAHISLLEGRWARKEFQGRELYNKVIAIIGLGNIGKALAKRAQVFGMKVIGYDPFISKEMAESLNIELLPLEEIWPKADYITVHTPLNDKTRNLINKDVLKKCKKGVFIINCARGGIVNEQDLVDALNEGIVAGAAFDVFTEEPPVNNPLIGHPKVVHTPHLGASTLEAQVNVAKQVAYQMIDALLGNGIVNAVNIPSFDKETYNRMKPFLELSKKLGKIANVLAEGQLKEINIVFEGNFGDMNLEALLNAALLGLFENTTSEINYVNAPFFAKEQGVLVNYKKSESISDYNNLITLEVKTDRGEWKISGTIYGKNDQRIVKINDYHFDAIAEKNLLIYKNEDRPGKIGTVGTILAKNNINIAQMFLSRTKPGGTAMTIMNVDQEVPQSVIDEILSHEGFLEVRQVSL